MIARRSFAVAVIGGGPAGLAAGLTAQSSTTSVAIINDAPAAGGQIWRRESNGARDGRSAHWIERLARSSITQINGATVIDARMSSDGSQLLIESDGRSEWIRAARVILATGARELFLPFPGWTLPGVLGVGGLQALAKSGLDVRGKRIVVAGTGPLLVAVAASLAKRGARIVALVEQIPMGRMAAFATRLISRPAIAGDAILYGASIRPWVLHFGSWVSAAHGGNEVRSATITNGVRTVQVDCDLLCVGYGLIPNTELGRLLGCAVAGSGIEVDGVQQSSLPGVFAAGECTGVGGVDAAIAEGIVAGHAAAGASPPRDILAARDRARAWGRTLDRVFVLRPELSTLATPDTIVCRCEDVRMGDIDPAWSARQGKLYRRLGMGACQGRVCGAAMQHLRGWSLDRIRAPIYPSFLSTMAEPHSDSTNPGAR